MAGKECDCCYKDDMETVVGSSVLGAASFAYCPICIAMAAEPKFMVDATIEILGLDNISKNVNLTYYDQDTDSYKDVREGDIFITLKDGTKIKTREEYWEKYVNKSNKSSSGR